MAEVKVYYDQVGNTLTVKNLTKLLISSFSLNKLASLLYLVKKRSPSNTRLLI
jgi:hypothetical protein